MDVYPKISLKNSKLGNMIPCINLQVGCSCRPDAPCYKNCYARKGHMAMSSVKGCYEKNYQAYIENPSKFFDVIDTYLTFCQYKFFRYHSAGDIVDEQYLHFMCQIARKHKGTTFLCFTKKYEIVNTYLSTHKKPKNLVLVLSNWGNWICDNPHGLPTAWVELGEDSDSLIPSNANKCSGFCGECADTKHSCWKMKNGDSVVFHKH